MNSQHSENQKDINDIVMEHYKPKLLSDSQKIVVSESNSPNKRSIEGLNNFKPISQRYVNVKQSHFVHSDSLSKVKRK